jgi:hypothetical protein
MGGHGLLRYRSSSEFRRVPGRGDRRGVGRCSSELQHFGILEAGSGWLVYSAGVASVVSSEAATMAASALLHWGWSCRRPREACFLPFAVSE